MGLEILGGSGGPSNTGRDMEATIMFRAWRLRAGDTVWLIRVISILTK